MPAFARRSILAEADTGVNANWFARPILLFQFIGETRDLSALARACHRRNAWAGNAIVAPVSNRRQ